MTESSHDISILFEFLQAFAPAVTRRPETLSADLETKIVQFANGELSPEERRAVAEEILRNRRAVELLAEQLRKVAA